MTRAAHEDRHEVPAEYLEDLQTAHAAVSETFGLPGPIVQVSNKTIGMFADVSGDNNPLHVDPEVAHSGPFKDCVAHGLLLVSLATGYARPQSPFRLTRRLPIMDGFSSIRFVRPVKEGSRITVRERVKRAEYVRRKGVVVTSEFEIMVFVGVTTKTAVVGEITILYA